MDVPETSADPSNVGGRPNASEYELLESFEKELAKSYGLAEPVYAAEVFDRTKAYGFQMEQRLQQLERLRELREHRADEMGGGTRKDSEEAIARCWLVSVPGIDAYQQYPLSGAVADAQAMANYFKDDLKVPSDRIQLLLGSAEPDPSASSAHKPTRENILNTLCRLATNNDILVNDHIIIFFSGHGSTYRCNDYFTENSLFAQTGFIQALCPMDKDPVDTTSPAAIPDISGRELNVIFTEIARQKGHKITVILDCCFSAGATKALQPVHRVRARPAQATILNSTESSLELMLKAGDDNLRRMFPDYATRKSVMAADWQQDVTSHVLLAACQDYQQAHEGQIGNVCRGLFTNSLICSLRLDMPGKGVSFVNFVKNLPRWANQEPVVSGDHKHEPIFYIT